MVRPRCKLTKKPGSRLLPSYSLPPSSPECHSYPSEPTVFESWHESTTWYYLGEGSQEKKAKNSMKPRYNWQENNILARCPDCDAVTSFDSKGHSNTALGMVIINSQHQYEGKTYTRILWGFFRCNVCNRGAVAKLHDTGQSHTAVLEDFLPKDIEKAALPSSLPSDIVDEFREAEKDAAHAAYRSASAMLRSVLEKALKKNGYEEVEYMDDKGEKKKSNSLLHRIDAAADDGVITETRKRRAHESIRVLGNDILHDDWRMVTNEEFEEAHKYTQRILEDFYDDRATVEARLTAKGRPFVKPRTEPAA